MNKNGLLGLLSTWVAYCEEDCEKCSYKKDCTQGYNQIVAIIKNQPTITEEWIEKKARELGEMTKHSDGQGVVYRKDISTCKDFVRSLVEETHGRK